MEATMTDPFALAEPTEKPLTRGGFIGTTIPQALLGPDESAPQRERTNILRAARAKAAPAPLYLTSLGINVESSITQQILDTIYTFDPHSTPHHQRVVPVQFRWVSPTIIIRGIQPATAEQIFDTIQAFYLSGRLRNRKIADRITALYRDTLEEDERILPASLSQFTDFFLASPNLRVPQITLTPDGTLNAHWIQAPRNFVAIEFVGGTVAKLVAEIPRNGLTAQHFVREALQNVVPIARTIGASIED
jgi:hypothetical protein